MVDISALIHLNVITRLLIYLLKIRSNRNKFQMLDFNKAPQYCSAKNENFIKQLQNIGRKFVWKNK